MPKLSAVAGQMLGQPMFQVLDKVKALEAVGRDVIHFEIGEPNFDTPAPIRDAAVTALLDGDTHYVSSWGITEFREACRTATENSRGYLPDLSQVLITPGANIAVFLVIVSLVDSDEEVLFPDPGFPTYEASIRAAGVIGRRYRLNREDSLRISADLIKEQINPKTKLIVINSPSNPTGAVSSRSELRRVFELAEEHDLFIFSDEIYARMLFEEDFFSISQLDEARSRVIVSNGFSKAFSMTGWRLGVLIGPELAMERMMLLLQTTLSCVPPFVQRAGLAALQGDQTEVSRMMRAYKRRRGMVVNLLSRIPGMEIYPPDGAFYAFPSIRNFGLSSEIFADRLLEEHAVAVLPGSNFGPGGEGHVRLSFASSENRIGEGIARIGDFCRSIGV